MNSADIRRERKKDSGGRGRGNEGVGAVTLRSGMSLVRDPQAEETRE